MDAREILTKIVLDALEEMNPAKGVGRMLRLDRKKDLLQAGEASIPLDGRQVHLIAAGKASVSMARAVEEALGDRLAEGLVVTPSGTGASLSKCRVLEGSHPWPESQNEQATDELLDYAGRIPEGSLVLCLISGGTSALLSKSAAAVTLEELRKTYSLLLDSGADIHQMNVVRTALSKVKGGQLLKWLAHVDLVDLIVSDVPGDKFRSIGSGPTTPGLVSRRQALRVVQQAGILADLPASVRSLLKREEEFIVQPHPGEHRQILVASARMLANEVAGRLNRAGYGAQVVTPAYGAPIEQVEEQMIDRICKHLEPGGEGASGSVRRLAGGGSDNGSRKSAGSALVWYGESSVHVTGGGKGGRNQELALRMARHLDRQQEVTFLSLGTDGVDGPTDAAGAVVDAATLEQARREGLDPEEYLARNDSYHFFEAVGGLIRTGPTGNNLMDLQVALIG